MKKFEVTFHLTSGKEIATITEAETITQARLVYKTLIARNESIALEEDLELVPKHVEYFRLEEIQTEEEEEGEE
jgi:hypothetical protein